MSPANNRPRGHRRVWIIIATCALILVGIFVKACVEAWNRADEAPKQTTCASNMKQLGLGLIQYAQDNDNCLPYGESTGLGDGWAGAIYPYEKSEVVYYCPSDTASEKSSDEPTASRLSYSINNTLTGDRQVPNCSTHTSRLANPSSTVMLLETTGALVKLNKIDEGRSDKEHSGWYSGAGDGMTNSSDREANLYAWGPIEYATGDIGTRHGMPSIARHVVGDTAERTAVANYLAADGHVAALPPWRVSSGTTPKRSGPQIGDATSGTAASTDMLGKFKLTFSAR